MIPWVITALVIIALVLLVGCCGLIWYVREQRQDIDLLTSKLIGILDGSDVSWMLFPPVTGPGDAERLPRGQD